MQLAGNYKAIQPSLAKLSMILAQLSPSLFSLFLLSAWVTFLPEGLLHVAISNQKILKNSPKLETCAENFRWCRWWGRAEGLVCTDLGVRTPIGTSEIVYNRAVG